MAVTVPALPATLPEPTELGTGQPILGGSSNALGLLVQALNLAHVTMGAGLLWQEGFADGQFNLAGSVDSVVRCHLKVPYVSAAHTTARLVVVASGGGTASDFVRLTCIANAETERTADVGALGVYTLDLDLTGGETTTAVPGGRDYFDLTLGIGGAVNVRSVHVAVLPAQVVTGSWPGSSGTLAAGAVDGFAPLDDGEVDEDQWLSAGLGLDILGNINAVRDRVRVRHSWSGVGSASPTASLYPEMAPVMQRVEGHCLDGDEPLRQAGHQPAHLWEVWIRVTSATVAQELTIEGGQVTFARLPVAAGASGWHHLWLDPRALLERPDLGELWASLRVRATGATAINSLDLARVDDRQTSTDNINAIVIWGP